MSAEMGQRGLEEGPVQPGSIQEGFLEEAWSEPRGDSQSDGGWGRGRGGEDSLAVWAQRRQGGWRNRGKVGVGVTDGLWRRADGERRLEGQGRKRILKSSGCTWRVTTQVAF